MSRELWQAGGLVSHVSLLKSQIIILLLGAQCWVIWSSRSLFAARNRRQLLPWSFMSFILSCIIIYQLAFWIKPILWLLLTFSVILFQLLLWLVLANCRHLKLLLIQVFKHFLILNNSIISMIDLWNISKSWNEMINALFIDWRLSNWIGCSIILNYIQGIWTIICLIL